MISSFFVSGTGRCGTLLLSEILNCSEHVHCNHEHSVDTNLLKKAFHKDNPKYAYRQLKKKISATISATNAQNKTYGEVSGHLYYYFQMLYERYGFESRFILLIRNPENFIRSALARGFFSKDHINGLEHVKPPKKAAVWERWDKMSSFEKCAWYWAVVNGMLYSFFLKIPHTLYKVIRIEDISIDTAKDLYQFLGIQDFSNVEERIKVILSKRYNASKGQTNDKELLNPYSTKISLGPMATWSNRQLIEYKRHVHPLLEIFYNNNSSLNSISSNCRIESFS